MPDIDNIIAALNLEYGANRRYAYQVEHSPFPRLNQLLEGIRRTEGDHVESMLAFLKAKLAADPAVGRGFATMLAHLKLNLEFERIAVEAYNRFAGEAADPALRKTFKQLSFSEAGHIQMFETLIVQIEANAYPVVLYCPICGWEIDFGVAPAEGAVVRCGACKALVTLGLDAGDFVAARRASL